jgi:hypothetical protein
VNTSGLVGYWKFDAVNESDDTLDYSGHDNDAQLSNITGSCGGGACPSQVTSRFGLGLDFDYVGDYVNVPHDDSLNMTEAFTLEAWIKTDSPPGASLMDIITKAEQADWVSSNFRFGIQSGNSELQFIIGDGSDTNSTLGTTDVLDGEWHHIVATFDNAADTMIIYLDGSVEASNTNAVVEPITNTYPVMIGRCRNSNTALFNGTIDEVRIWNRTLTRDDVRMLYGLGRTYPDQTIFFLSTGENMLSNPGFEDNEFGCGTQPTGWNSFSCTSEWGYNSTTDAHSGIRAARIWLNVSDDESFLATQSKTTVVGQKYMFRIWAKSDNSTELRVRLQNSSWQTDKVCTFSNVPSTWSLYECPYTATDTTTRIRILQRTWGANIGNTTIDDVEFFSLGDSDVYYDFYRNGTVAAIWRFDEGMGNYTFDETGNNNTGTIIDDENDHWVTGRFGQALEFDGSDDYVNILDRNILDIVGDVTIEAWIKPIELSGYQFFVSKEYRGEYEIGSNDDDLIWRAGNGTSWTSLSWNNFFSEGNDTWYHVVAVRNLSATDITVYKNGIQFGTSQGYTIDPLASTWNLSIGSRSGGSFFFNGTIDEVKIYPSTLSPEEILCKYGNNCSEAGFWNDTSNLGAGFYYYTAKASPGENYSELTMKIRMYIEKANQYFVLDNET